MPSLSRAGLLVAGAVIAVSVTACTPRGRAAYSEDGRIDPGLDSMGPQTPAVTCAPGQVRTIDLTWAYDNGWRATPGYTVSRSGTVSDYPGCAG